MACPFCGTRETDWRKLHRHLADMHAGAVVRRDDLQSGLSFDVACPRCGWVFAQPLRGRRRDAAFLDEYAQEITLVAFDQLMVHWIEDHATQEELTAMGVDSGDSERL
jgi:hypothetical protein